MSSTSDTDSRYAEGRYDGVIERLDRTGDTKIMWDKSNPVEVAAAKAAFEAAQKEGALIYKVEGKQGERGEKMKDFDKKVQRMIIVPQLVGG